ncbi:MAG: N-acetyl-gamma-glutamyl-phosphate reductase [bacterium]
MGTRTVIAGASGYAGGELVRLVGAHPDLDLVGVTAHGQAGQPLGRIHPHLRRYGDLVLGETNAATLADADLVFLALPHGTSAGLAAGIGSAVAIVDLGADHRLRDAQTYTRTYGGPHPGAWTYGLPELPGLRAEIATSRRVANTGCYAVAVITALAPLIAAGLAEPQDVVVVAASGTSGAGTSVRRGLLATEVMGDLSAYKVGAHQHVAEILQATGAETLSMTPILAPIPRGILATVTTRVTRPVTSDDLRTVLTEAYAEEPFVCLLPENEWPHTAATLGSNSVHLQATVDASSGRAVVVSAIDNLGKGAAGQAVQNANLMLGFPETTGLSIDGTAP